MPDSVWYFCCLQSTKTFQRKKGAKISSPKIYFKVETINLFHWLWHSIWLYFSIAWLNSLLHMATLDTCDLQIVLKKIWTGNVGLDRVSYLAMENDIETIWSDQLEISTTPFAFDCRLWQRRGAFDDSLGGVWYLNRKCQAWSGPFFLVVRRRSVSEEKRLPCAGSSPPRDVSRGGTSATQRQKFHTNDVNQCVHNISGRHGAPHANLFNFTFLRFSSSKTQMLLEKAIFHKYWLFC